jgi:hypothetical protein
MARAMTYPSLGAFYEADRRRATSRERDIGLWWKGDGPLSPTYRAAYVESTGEVYLMQHEGTLGGGHVDVVGRFESFAEVHRLVQGWEDVCGERGSIRWLLKRVPRRLAEVA